MHFPVAGNMGIYGGTSPSVRTCTHCEILMQDLHFALGIGCYCHSCQYQSIKKIQMDGEKYIESRNKKNLCLLWAHRRVSKAKKWLTVTTGLPGRPLLPDTAIHRCPGTGWPWRCCCEEAGCLMTWGGWTSYWRPQCSTRGYLSEQGDRRQVILI